MTVDTTTIESPLREQTPLAKALSANDIYGGVIGTVFASATLAAIPTGPSPGYSAVWVAASVAIAALTRSYGQHVSTHQAGTTTSFVKDLRSFMLTGIPMVLTSTPTLIALWVAHLTGWRDDVIGVGRSLAVGYTSFTLMMNAGLLFGWGVVAGRISGYSRWGSCVVGLANTGLGVAVIIVNLMIK
ncbi:hypothetical protein ACQ86B_22380 [Mycolicibacterium aichiense]|uniref:hypothetical protein n=1 Tax=Mycolicibacterium aichiense TaxID=1799 RepID=UPI003D666528